MELKVETVSNACKQVSREVRDYYKSLTLHFVVHHEGHQAESLGISAKEIISHPAAETAIHLMKQSRETEESTLIGISAARKNMFFGLIAKDPVLAIATVNIDDFESFREIKRYAYHTAWHAIDAYAFFRDQDDSRVRKKNNIIRQRNAMEILRANLSADVFSAVMSTLHGDREAVKRIAALRSEALFKTISGDHPELYPFGIVAEATAHAIKQGKKQHIPKRRYISAALRMAGEINKTYENKTILDWLFFATKAQELSWRGHSKKDALGLAVNMSKDTEVKSTAYLVSEILGVKPPASINIEAGYNPYADDDFNESLHNKHIDLIFEDVIVQGLKEGSAENMIELADQQNKRLAEGHIFGWCAAALQSAAQSFENAIAGGKEPESPVTENFISERSDTDWDALKEIGERVVHAKREGDIVTMNTVREIAGEIENADNIAHALEKTIEGPRYQKQLENVAEPKPEPELEQELAARPAPAHDAQPEAAPDAPKQDAPRVIPAAAALPPQAAQFVRKMAPGATPGPAAPGGNTNSGITAPCPAKTHDRPKDKKKKEPQEEKPSDQDE